MLYIRKLKPKLNTQVDSELFTLVIRNAKLETANERDQQTKDISKKRNKPNNVAKSHNEYFLVKFICIHMFF